MWEYRLTWTAQPAWWERAWEQGQALLARGGRRPESRPDTYLVLSDRVDVGIKLRGSGGERQFEIKTRDQQGHGWELWEKNVIVSWNDLERARVAALMRLGPPLGAADAATAWDGVTRALGEVGLTGPALTVDKERIQAAAGPLLTWVPAFAGSEHWLAELTEFQLPSRSGSVWSICLEQMGPVRAGDPLPRDGALACGYPELLARHVAGKL